MPCGDEGRDSLSPPHAVSLTPLLTVFADTLPLPLPPLHARGDLDPHAIVGDEAVGLSIRVLDLLGYGALAPSQGQARAGPAQPAHWGREGWRGGPGAG